MTCEDCSWHCLTSNEYYDLTEEEYYNPNFAGKLTPIYDAYYKSITKEEFYEILEEVVFKLLKYAVLYMIHGRLYLHDEILHVGDSIPDVLRNHLSYMDGTDFFYR